MLCGRVWHLHQTEKGVIFVVRVDVLFVAALFALISNVDISININKEDKHDDG